MDSDPATDCEVCAAGKFNSQLGATSITACIDCPLGYWADAGADRCSPCVPGYYGTAAGCMPCSGEGWLCDVPGLTGPRAAVGYYASTASTNASQFTISKCVPFEACLGTCDQSEREQLLLVKDNAKSVQCAAATGEESCSPGYEGPRCSMCTEFAEGVECSADQVNGYYRRNQRCVPCPCGSVTFSMMVGAAAVSIVAFMSFLDCFVTSGGETDSVTEHASTLVAPAFILVTFGQTISVFTDLKIPWPATLKDLMAYMSALNINLELTRPECSMKIGPLEKTKFTILMPLFFMSIVCLYSGVRVLQFTRCKGLKENEQQDARQQIYRRTVTIATTVFTVGKISTRAVPSALVQPVLDLILPCSRPNGMRRRSMGGADRPGRPGFVPRNFCHRGGGGAGVRRCGAAAAGRRGSRWWASEQMAAELPHGGRGCG